MLIVEPPSKQAMLKLLRDLVDGDQDRKTVFSWQQALVAQYGWEIPLTVAEGYWYFYSLGALLDTTYFGEPLLRDEDLFEYRLDLEGITCSERIGGIVRYRAHQRPGQDLMWPLFECARTGKGLNELGFQSVRGVFEKRDAVVEQLTLMIGTQHFLVLTHPDDPEGKIYVLGETRSQTELPMIIEALGLRQ
ncbi:MAG: hypothetical protein ACPHAN_14470 [Pseudomonadales bacterium]